MFPRMAAHWLARSSMSQAFSAGLDDDSDSSRRGTTLGSSRPLSDAARSGMARRSREATAPRRLGSAPPRAGSVSSPMRSRGPTEHQLARGAAVGDGRKGVVCIGRSLVAGIVPRAVGAWTVKMALFSFEFVFVCFGWRLRRRFSSSFFPQKALMLRFGHKGLLGTH